MVSSSASLPDSVLRASSLRHLDELIERFPLLFLLCGPLCEAVEMLCRCHRTGGKVLVCGNGGSAADSEHIVAELMKNFVLPRRVLPSDIKQLQSTCPAQAEYLGRNLQPGLSAIALTTNPALASAIANDTDANLIFAQQVYVYGQPGDVLIAISTSGNSRNVVAALQVARAFGLNTLGLGGEAPAAMDEWCDVLLKAPAAQTTLIQELHLPLYHTLCLMVEEELFGGDI